MNPLVTTQAPQQPTQQLQQQQSLAGVASAATNLEVVAAPSVTGVTNSPASPLASPSTAVATANMVNAGGTSFAIPLDAATAATIGSQELHDALEAACCQAASSIMNENG